MKRVCLVQIAMTAVLMALAAPAMAWNDDDSRDSRNGGSQGRYDRNNDRDRNDSRYDRSDNKGIIPPFIKERMDANGPR